MTLLELTRFGGHLTTYTGGVHDAEETSRQLRRDRELAFYGAEDLTPNRFYTETDAEEARASARNVVKLIKPHVPDPAGAPESEPE